MNIIKYSLLILTVIFPCYCYGELVTENNLTPDVIASTIKKRGFNYFISRIPDGSDEWDFIMEHIASGDQKWLDTVPLMTVPGSEGWMEDLQSSLGEALPKNAKGVMDTIDKYPNILFSQVCSMPLYGKTVAEREKYVVDSIQALYKVNSVASKKCLGRLIDVVGNAPKFTDEAL